MAVTTMLSASIDAKKSGDLWMVCVSILDADGKDLHTQFSDPASSESANHTIGNRLLGCEILGIPADLTAAARELREWWDTDRFEIVYARHGGTLRDAHPTLEAAWRAGEGISDMGAGFVYEIRECESDRLLYEVKKVMRGWERIADDVPPVEEMEAAKT